MKNLKSQRSNDSVRKRFVLPMIFAGLAVGALALFLLYPRHEKAERGDDQDQVAERYSVPDFVPVDPIQATATDEKINREPVDPKTVQPDPRLGDEGPGKHFERYNFRSGRMAANILPEDAHPQTHVKSSFGRPQLTVWAESGRVPVGGRVKIFATLFDDKNVALRPSDFSVTVASMFGTKISQKGVLTPMAASQNGVWEYEWFAQPSLFEMTKPGSDSIAAPVELNVVVRATGTLGSEHYERSAATMLSVDSPGGKFLADKMGVSKSGGDIELAIEAEITRPGTYWMHAELWGGSNGDVPIAFGVDRLEHVRAGHLKHTLLFGGAIIRDRKIDGPFKVRNIRLNQVDTLPPHESDPIDELAPTPAWLAADFH
jgi:hypothetical protein